MSIKFPVYRPRFTGKEKDLVLDCLESTWISSKGKYIGQFESRFADYLGTAHAVAVSNGTVALHVALEALGIGPGDEVLLPTLTYIASANAVTYTGATPVFVDSETEYWQIDPADAGGPDHAAHQGHHAGASLRPRLRHGADHGDREAAWPEGRGGLRRGDRHSRR